MSLLGRNLGRIAKIAIFVATAIVFPNQTANADYYSDWVAINTTNVGSQNWSATASSYSGSVLYAGVNNGYLYRSMDSGTSWTRLDNAGNKAWVAMAVNDSGTIIYAAAYNDYIYKSSDSGTTWESITASVQRSWKVIATSSSGQVIMGTYGVNAYTFNKNYGISTWTQDNGSVGNNATGLTLSGDGSKIVIQSTAGLYVGTSNGAGYSWSILRNVLTDTSTVTQSVSMSRDGQKIVALGKEGTPHISVNGGATWDTATAPLPGIQLDGVQISGDGSRIGVFKNLTGIYYSSDSGSTWSLSSGYQTGSWAYLSANYSGTTWLGVMGSFGYTSYGIYISSNSLSTLNLRQVADGSTKVARIEATADGSHIAILNQAGDIWVSNDSGATWTVTSNSYSQVQYQCLAMSSNGQKIVVGTNNQLLISSNYGSSFTQITSGVFSASPSVTGCAVSADGNKIVVTTGTQSNGVQYSTDGGSSFSLFVAQNKFGTNYTYKGLAMSSDGSKIVVTASSTTTVVFSTRNSGTSWETSTVPNGNYQFAKSSADGSVMVVYSGLGWTPQISKNSGLNWSPLPSTITNYFSQDGISISADGSLIITGSSLANQNVYQSTNFGDTFTAIQIPLKGYQQAVKITNNQSQLFLATLGQQVFRANISKFQFAGFSTMQLSVNAKYRTESTITATISSAAGDGKVTFYANGKKIPGCIKVSTTALIASCVWKPASRGAVVLSATSYPADSSYASASSTLQITVGNRTGNR